MQLRSLLQRLRARIPDGVLGGALLFGGTTVVNAGNYAFNLVLGRWLGPAAFADASLIITLFLVVTFVAVALQTTAAKFTAAYIAADTAGQAGALRRWLGRYAWYAGLALAVVFGCGAPLWQAFFHTSSPWPFVAFALGIPFYFAQGVDRGVLQGQTRFGALTLTYQAEMWARLLIAVGLVALGWSVFGAVVGLALSLAVAWVVALWTVRALPASGLLPESERGRVIQFAVPVVTALVGQILINNSDILLVKRFFSADEAGMYAALALIGRIVFFATWSIVTVLFPMVARRHQRGEPHRNLLYAGLGLVAAISGAIVAATLLAPELIVGVLFGPAYLSVAGLLAPYAVATALYALANVVINYRLSLDNGGGSLVALIAGVAQVLGLVLFHGSLYEVVLVQVYVMAGLVGVLFVWDGWLSFRARASASVAAGAATTPTAAVATAVTTTTAASAPASQQA